MSGNRKEEFLKAYTKKAQIKSLYIKNDLAVNSAAIPPLSPIRVASEKSFDHSQGYIMGRKFSPCSKEVC